MRPQEIVILAHLVDRAPHQPDHPAWRSYAGETAALYEAIPVQVIWTEEPTPSTEFLFQCIRLGFMPVFAGGFNAPQDHPGHKVHPVWSQYRLGREWVSLNNLARAVHDWYGHWLPKAPFETFEGELVAYYAQRRLHSPTARPVLFADGPGQLAYNVHFNRFMPTQRAIVLPEVFV